MENYLDVSEEEELQGKFQYLGPSKVVCNLHNKNYEATLTTTQDLKNIEVRIGRNLYNISIVTQLDQTIDQMGLAIQSQSDAGDIFSPMPGLVLEILVSENEEVKTDQPLVILEAMKMENIIKASGDGIVKAIHIAPKETVEKGQLLIVLKPSGE